MTRRAIFASIVATLVYLPCNAFSTGRRSGSTSGGCGKEVRSQGVVSLQSMIDDNNADMDVPLDDILLAPPAITASNDNDEDVDANNEEDNQSSTPPSTVFTATPITITPTTSKFIAASTSSNKREPNKVNSATLRFNNRLNQLAKNWDDSTAPKVEALLLDALEKYQLHLAKEEKEEQQGGESTSSTKTNNMIIPNTISFTNAITAWARCTRKDSAHRAQSLLNQMLTLYNSSKQTNNNTSTGQSSSWDHIKPNKISYNSVITAWARSNDRRTSARQAEELLRSMYDFYNNESGLDPDCKPDARSFNAVINAVARSRSPNCADRAKFLLDEMGRLYNEGDEDLLPDALTFGAIINAYANSLEAGSSDKAAQLLMHMESLYSMGFEQAKPTTFVYNACMNAFAKDPLICVMNEESGSNSTTIAFNRAEKAEQLLTSMEKRYNDEKDWRIKPDIISYSTVINAHANSGTTNAGMNADGILRRMLHRYLMGDTKCRPNAIVFTAAIKAHSTSINATLSSGDTTTEDDDEASNKLQKQQQQVKASAKRCEDLLQELCLLYQLPGNDRSLKPTSVTFELVIGALTLAEEWEGVERITALREEGMFLRD